MERGFFFTENFVFLPFLYYGEGGWGDEVLLYRLTTITA